MTFIGANQMTLTGHARTLHPGEYDVRILHVRQENKEAMLADSILKLKLLQIMRSRRFNHSALAKTDVLVVATGSEERK